VAKTISKEYQEQLLAVRQGPGKWGTTAARNAGAPVAEIVHRVHRMLNGRPPLVLDYGAGEGMLAEYLHEHTEAHVYEYDPCVEGKQEMPDAAFDLVVSSDVLEHVEAEYIPAVLDECFRKADIGVFHHISTCLTGRKLPDGRDFHISCHEHAWWYNRLAVAASKHNFVLMESQDVSRRQRGSYTTASRFYYERG